MSIKPVICKNETQVGDAAFDGTRRRPVVAINEEGKLVVCCKRTAKLHGWQLQEVLYVKAPKQQRRATDTGEAVVVKKTTVKKAKEVVDNMLDDLLGE